MKPYKVGSMWVDLDHVLSVDDETLWEPWASHWIGGNVILAFRDSPLYIFLVHVRATYNPEDGDPMTSDYTFNQDDIKEAKETWEAFKTAWKTKDTMFGGSK